MLYWSSQASDLTPKSAQLASDILVWFRQTGCLWGLARGSARRRRIVGPSYWLGTRHASVDRPINGRDELNCYNPIR